MKLISINLAKKEKLEMPKRTVYTGIYKQPSLFAKVNITKMGVEGDVIADKKVHGGLDQAIYIYGLEDYEWWSKQLNRPLQPGTFGENLTISGFDQHHFAIGDRLIINQTILEISAPRTPCSILAARMGDADFVNKFIAARRPGAYARVITEGEIEVGAEITLIKSERDYPSIDEIFVEWHQKNKSREVLRKALASPLSQYHREKIQQWFDRGIATAP